jgi:hypothetical protein
MRKILAIILMSSFLTCASLFGMNEDCKIGYPDNDETCYQNDNKEEDFQIVDDGEQEADCEKVGYTDDQ